MHRHTLFLLIFVLTVLPLVGCADRTTNSPPPIPKPTERVATLMGGHAHAQAIIETGKATAYRITNPEAEPRDEKLGPGVHLTAEQRAAIAALLARDDAYEWDVAKGCEPMPGVLIAFEDGATFARVRLCFSCQMIGFTPGSWEDFDPINKQMVAWVKGVFPDDKAIQSLGTAEEPSGL